MYIGIDQSKRSTASVALNRDGSMRSFLLINQLEENEDLILKQWCAFDDWLLNSLGYDDPCGALIEGLSFGSVGSGKDFLAGLQWYFRARFALEYSKFLGTTPVSQWRSKVLSKDEQKAAKAEGKEGLKKACVDKLPEEVKLQFSNYLQQNEKQIRLVKKSLWKDCIYDLTDAYWIAEYCRSLNKNINT